MLYSLIVKPIALAALGLVLWILWRAAGHLGEAERRSARRSVLAGGGLIALLVLGPDAWAVLRDRPGEVAAWVAGLAIAAALIWLYARLIRAARRRAGRRDD